MTQGGSQNKNSVLIWVSSKTCMTFHVLQEISKQTYVMNIIKQTIYMCENIYISCERFQEMSTRPYKNVCVQKEEDTQFF